MVVKRADVGDVSSWTSDEVELIKKGKMLHGILVKVVEIELAVL